MREEEGEGKKESRLKLRDQKTKSKRIEDIRMRKET